MKVDFASASGMTIKAFQRSQVEAEERQAYIVGQYEERRLVLAIRVQQQTMKFAGVQHDIHKLAVARIEPPLFILPRACSTTPRWHCGSAFKRFSFFFCFFFSLKKSMRAAQTGQLAMANSGF